MNKEHKDLDTIDLEAPRFAQHVLKACKNHQNTVYWVDINLALRKVLKFLSDTMERYHSSRNTPSSLNKEIRTKLTWKHCVLHSTCRMHGRNIKTQCIRSTSNLLKRKVLCSIRRDRTQWVDINLSIQKGLKFYQTRSNAIILQGTLTAYCIPKVVRVESGEIIYEKVYVSPRPPPTTSFKDNWMKELGESEDSQKTQPRSNTKLLSTARFVKSCVPVSVERLDKDEDADENVDTDFRVSALPHVVKQAENFSVRGLVKKSESHPHRQALQADLQQSNVYNPFRDDAQAMILEMGNVELFELRETIPKEQSPECFPYWNQGVI